MNKLILYIILVALIGGALWWFFMKYPDTRNETQNIPTPETTIQDTVTIIAFGDSLTAGYGVSQNEAYPAQLETMLREAGYPVTVINAGVSGETTRGNLERANFIRSQNPDIVILGIGGNDALRALPVLETKKNIVATVQALREDETPPVILLLEMQAPLNMGLSYKKEFDDLYQAIAREEELTLVPFITKMLFLDNTNKLEDGIHYNATGYQKVVEQYVFPSVVEVLENMDTTDE